MKNKIFGFNRQEVANYLEQLLRLQESEICKLHDEHKLIIEENKQMRQRIEELNSELSSMQDMSALDFLMERLESIYKYLDKYTDEATGKILNQKFSAKKKLNEQIEIFSVEIQEVKNSIKKELDQINKLIKSSNFIVVSNSNPVNEKSTGPLLEYTKPENPNKDSQSNNKPIAADGTTFQERQAPSPESSRKKPAIVNDENPAFLEFSAFWGKNDPRELDLKKQSPETESIYLAPELRESSPIIQQTLNLQTSNIQTLKETINTAREPEPKTDRDLKAKIDLVRNKYILGKFAGEDVLDKNGNYIIRKHEEITPAVLEAAQRENKLSDIIINMIIPGMDE